MNLSQGGWGYIRTGLGRHGRSLSENNFAKERRDWLAILLREVLQNALDARLAKTEPVLVTLNRIHLGSEARAYMSSLVTAEHCARYSKSMPHVHDDGSKHVDDCLVVEDFGTTGLTGLTDNPAIDGKGQNWNAFWFREGEGGKENTSGNGGAGQGKITYFSTSGIRTIFAYTVRCDDGRGLAFGASSFLRDYDHDGHKWKRDAYWGVWHGGVADIDRTVLPVEGFAAIQSFCQGLGIRRTTAQPGLSLVIPSPKAFNEEEALQITLAEFFVPILRGDLIVQIGNVKLDRETARTKADLLLSDARARELNTCTTKAYRAFLATAVGRTSTGEMLTVGPITSAADISESLFPSDQLEALKEAFDDEEVVSVRFQLTVKPRSGNPDSCAFDVHLAAPMDLDRPEQAIVRKDLLVGEEPIGGGKLRQRVRGLVLVSDDSLSRLLLSAEEATHLRWNTRLPRLAEYYKSGGETVSIVRNAMARLLDVLTGGEQKRDFKLLAKYFSAPGSDARAKGPGKQRKAKVTTAIKPEVPASAPKLLALDAMPDGCRVRPFRADSLSAARLPVSVRVEFAYEGLDRDAFAEYDPLDFDIKDSAFVIQCTGCTVKSALLNVLEFVVEVPEFKLTLTGFDKNLRLRMRLNYEESEDAKAIDSQ